MLKLRSITESDLEKIMNWRMQKDVTRYMYTDPTLTLDLQKEWFNKIKQSTDSKYWLISYNDNDLGVLSITNIDEINRHCFWAYYIAEDGYRGKGIGRNLECNVYDFCFDNLELNKVNCEVLEFNKKVVEIHEHFGAKTEGLFREHIFKNGKFHNVVRMGILKDEWKKIKENFDYVAIAIES